MRTLLRWAPALMAGAALLGTPGEASAGLTLTATTSDGHSTSASGANVAALNGVTVGDFLITASATSDSPGVSGNAGGYVTNVQTSAQNTSGTSTETITFTVTADGFTLPGAINSPEQFNSSISTNPLLDEGPQPIAFTSYLIQGSLTQNTPTQYVATTGMNVLNNALTASFTRTTSSYSLSNVTVLTLDAGASGNSSGQTQVATRGAGTATTLTSPEPGTIAMALTGLPIASLYLRRRRRAGAKA